MTRLVTDSGRVNAHTHIYSGLAPLGMPEPNEPPQNFVQILERVWWRLDRALDERSLAASARYYVAESLLAGTTTLIDHHESPNYIAGSMDLLADACQELGARAVLCYGATERNRGRQEAEQGLAECRRFLQENDRPLIAGVVGLHASFTVSDDTIREAAELCREYSTVLHLHVAEDGADVDDARERGYPGPLERLLALDALPSGSLLAHGVYCTPDQVRTAAEHGCWFLHNPRSNRGNNVGYAANLIHSDQVAVGTDGYPSRMDDEAAVLYEEGRAHNQTEGQLNPRLAAGHRLTDELVAGSGTRPGPKADTASWEDGVPVEVTVGGRRVVADGRLLTADIEAIREQAGREADRLWQRMADLPADEETS